MYSADFFKNPIALNRSLTNEERTLQLKQTDELTEFDATLPHYELAVIQQNSTFVELTDRNYAVRGIATGFFGGFCIFVFYLYTVSYYEWLTKGNDPKLAFYNFGLGDHLYYLLAIVSLLWILLREIFTYTHFPIRLNRKNRMVYVWRKNGQTLKAPWDKLFFCLRGYSDMGGKTWDIRGYVLDDDGITVKDSFPFSSYSSSDAKDLREHFEYFRRYMENGPEQPHRMLKICLPIATRRETWWEGFMRLLLNMNGWPLFQIVFSPFYFVCSLGRWFAMRTSRIPQWPHWVEQECAIEPNDPYKRESGWEASREKLVA